MKTRIGARVAAALLAAAAIFSAAAFTGCSGSQGTANPPLSRGAVQSASPSPTSSVSAASLDSAATTPVVFAVIGDYGMDDSHERSVEKLVASWHPSYIVAAGDDYYKPAGGSGTGKYDESTGAYYGKWLKDITTTGKRYPVGKASVNSFFPVLGNHDYSDATPSPRTYLSYFNLPGTGYANSSGTERYYEFVRGPVHFFMLNSNKEEPAGTSSTSTQGMWLKGALGRSKSRFNIVVDHHPPYSSDSKHHSSTYMRWPFASWGADAVLSGHAHVYERVSKNGIAYFVNGLGGAGRYSFGTPVSGSKVRFRTNWGAQKVTISGSTMKFEFYDITGKRRDSYSITR